VPGDTNCDTLIDQRDVAALVRALFSGSACGGSDVNGDTTVSAADFAALAPLLGAPRPTLPPTATATATASATPSASRTATATATPRDCPGGAELQISVENPGMVAAVGAIASGRLLKSTCRNNAGLLASYEMNVGDEALTITNLAPGLWVHSFRVHNPNTGQRQYRQTLLLANGGTNRVSFTVMASVFTVRNPDDGSGSSTLRDAVRNSANAAKPHLIQFDEITFPSGEPTSIVLNSALPALTGAQVTIDGTDADGTAGNRIIDAGGRAIAGFTLSGTANTLVGLRIRNTGGNNRDVLSIAGAEAKQNRIERCIIDTSTTGDAVGVDDAAGGDFLQNANVITDTEIYGASDKGIKVTTGSHLRVERSWLHDNVNGGIQATLSGNVLAMDNLIERSTGTATAQNGLSVNGAALDTPMVPSQLFAYGNIARFNGGNGLSLRGYSVAFVDGNYFSANQRDGIRLSSEGDSPSAVIEGSSAVCNAVNGATVEGMAQGDFGGGPLGSHGGNAFTQNNLPGGAENFLNLIGDTTFAVNNQWEHCGTAATCNEQTVADYDIGDHGRITVFKPAQAHRTGVAPAITAVRPSSGKAGDLVRILGNGFNAIDGHDAQQCADLTVRNRCAPLRGNCVRIGDVPAVLEAVTPTMLVIRLPFTCVEPVPLTVTTQGGGISAPALLCTNAVP
jgi:hypothetical protein